MTFCGTMRDHEGAGFLSLAMHCIALYDPLLKIEDGRYEKDKKKEQLELFPLTVEQREEYASLVKTMRYFLDVYREEKLKTKPKSKPFSSFDRTRGLDYCNYEFYDFWYSFIGSFKNDFVFELRVNMLDAIAMGVSLKTYEPTIKFLSKLNSEALGRHHSYRKGCF